MKMRNIIVEPKRKVLLNKMCQKKNESCYIDHENIQLSQNFVYDELPVETTDTKAQLLSNKTFISTNVQEVKIIH